MPQDLWERAQCKLLQRRRVVRDKEQLLAVLRARLAENPLITELDLEALGLFSRETYVNSFGSLKNALEQAGRDSAAVRSQHKKRALEARRRGDELEEEIAALLRSAGMDCQSDSRSRVMLVDNRCSMRTKLLWPRNISVSNRWHIAKVRRPVADWVLLAQMQDDKSVSHFMLLPYAEYLRGPSWISEKPPPRLAPLHSYDQLQEALLKAVGK